MITEYEVPEHLLDALAVARVQTVYDYGALDSTGEFRELAGDAMFILAVVIETGLWNPVYGIKAMQMRLQGDVLAANGKWLLFAVKNEDLAHLCAAVEAVKGYHEYDDPLVDQ